MTCPPVPCLLACRGMSRNPPLCWMPCNQSNGVLAFRKRARIRHSPCGGWKWSTTLSASIGAKAIAAPPPSKKTTIITSHRRCRNARLSGFSSSMDSGSVPTRYSNFRGCGMWSDCSALQADNSPLAGIYLENPEVGGIAKDAMPHDKLVLGRDTVRHQRLTSTIQKRPSMSSRLIM